MTENYITHINFSPNTAAASTQDDLVYKYYLYVHLHDITLCNNKNFMHEKP